MTPRGGGQLAADRFAADQLLLKVSESYDRSVFDLDAYDEFIERSAAGRDYQADAIRTVLRLFCSGRYKSSEQLICRVVCQVGVFDRVRVAGVVWGGRESGAPGSVSAL